MHENGTNHELSYVRLRVNKICVCVRNRFVGCKKSILERNVSLKKMCWMIEQHPGVFLRRNFVYHIIKIVLVLFQEYNCNNEKKIN